MFIYISLYLYIFMNNFFFSLKIYESGQCKQNGMLMHLYKHIKTPPTHIHILK